MESRRERGAPYSADRSRPLRMARLLRENSCLVSPVTLLSPLLCLSLVLLASSSRCEGLSCAPCIEDQPLGSWDISQGQPGSPFPGGYLVSGMGFELPTQMPPRLWAAPLYLGLCCPGL